LKIQFHDQAYSSLQNSISQADEQELTTTPPADRDSHMDRPSLGNTYLQGTQQQDCSDTRRLALKLTCSEVPQSNHEGIKLSDCYKNTSETTSTWGEGNKQQTGETSIMRGS